jgi:hypothetical protein
VGLFAHCLGPREEEKQTTLPNGTIDARRATNMTQANLSASGVSLKAIEDFEAGKREMNTFPLQAIRSALETAGWRAGSDALSTELGGITIDPRKQGFGDELE